MLLRSNTQRNAVISKVKLIGLFIFLPSKSQTFVFHPVESVISHVVVWRQKVPVKKSIGLIAITPSAPIIARLRVVFFWGRQAWRQSCKR